VLAFLARLLVRARVGVVAAYAVLIPLCALFGAGVLQKLQPGGFRDPNAESTKVAERGRAFVSGDLLVVYVAKPGASPGGGGGTNTVDDVEGYAALVPALARVEDDPAVEKVISFFNTGAPWLVSKDRQKTVALVTLKGTDPEKVASWKRLTPSFNAEGFDVLFGGYAPVFDGITATVEHDLRRAELYALPLTLILLLLLFRSVMSAALPVVLGGAAIAVSLMVLRALDWFGDVTIYAANVATILGLGLAVDYSLFVLMRFREELPKAGPRRAVVRAMATAGRAVAFSGATVAVSLCGLFAFPHGMLRSVAIGGIAVTLATVFLSMTLLPALLALLATRVDAFKIPFGLPLPGEERDDDLWHRISRAVMKKPLLMGAFAVTLLLVCAVPFQRLAPSIADARALSHQAEARRAQDVVENELAPHMSTPHEIIIEANAPWTAESLGALFDYAERLKTVSGIAQVTSPLMAFAGDRNAAVRTLLGNDPAANSLRGLFLHETSARLSCISQFAVDDERALSQVQLLRAVQPPPNATVLVGGQSAWVVDVRDALKRYTPPMVGFIAVAMLVVLFTLFGSIVLPVKAVAMNLLSLTASFGAIVWIFQDGRFTTFLGYEPLSTTESSVPVLMFAIVFGLSMDYEVLLLSRVREEYLATGDNGLAVARALSRTGRLITSAALLLVVVVGSFATSSLVLIKTLAVGIAVAVLLDATIVRSLLVPATMRLLGAWNWWAPKPLAKLWARLFG
jgi:trehalose monomycolate/heme transporter